MNHLCFFSEYDVTHMEKLKDKDQSNCKNGAKCSLVYQAYY
jgi:hypothetical protein